MTSTSVPRRVRQAVTPRAAHTAELKILAVDDRPARRQADWLARRFGLSAHRASLVAEIYFGRAA